MNGPRTVGGADSPARIGRYDVTALLGSGGFAVVYRAQDSALNAAVAIKMLDAPSDAPSVVRERFVTEAQLLRRVDNPHVVTVYDIGETPDGRPYFVMEYADSGVLSQRIPPRPGMADAASLRTVVAGLGRALGALHEAGIVHRDVKPANIFLTVGMAGGTRGSDTVIEGGILRAGERVVVGDLGIAKDNERESSEPTILGGTPSFRAPEQMLRGAEITPAADVFGATGVLWNLLTASTPPDQHTLEVQLESVPVAWRPVLRRGFHVDPAQRHESAAAWVKDCLDAIGEADGKTPLGFASIDRTATCPYKGLAAYQPDDAALFFGREALIDQLLQRLQAASTLVVGGPSGSGKSSLVRAGLLPALERGVLPGSQHWRVATFTPGTDALGELAFQLSRLAGEELISVDDLRHEGPAVRRALVQKRPVILAIDQFEELFSINDQQTATEFVGALETLTAGSHTSVRVVIIVRADFYDACANYQWLAEQINANQVLVGPMTSAELRRAIEGPAQQTGLHLESGLVDEMLDDAGASAGSLPLLAHALMETWLRRRGHQLTVAGYRSAGGVAGAIAQRAEETFDRLTPSNKERARSLVLQMTSPGDGGPDTRRLLAWEDVGDIEDARPVIDTFVDARLVTSTDDHIELAHETLLRSWPRAREWIDGAREDLRTRQRLGFAAREWLVGDSDDDMLLRGTPLASMLEWSDDHPVEVTGDARTFLDASRAASQARDSEVEAERARSRRNRRLAFAALSILLVAAIFQSVAARRSESVANEATETAQHQVTLGLASTAEAQAAADPLFAIALAAESAARDEPAVPQSYGALATGRSSLALNDRAPVPLSDAIAVGNVLHIELTADGSLLILGSRNGDVTFWDVESRSVISVHSVHTKGVESIALSDELGLAATGGADGQILLWDLTEKPFAPELVDTIAGLAVWSVQFDPNSSTLGVVTSDAGVTFYDVASRTKIGQRIESALERDALRSTFNADGSELLVGNSKGELIRIDVDSRQPMGVLSPHATNIWDIERSADDAYVYTASNDGTLRRIDLATMTLDEGFVAGMESTVVEMRGVEALANGVDVISGAANGHIQLWNAETGALTATSTASHEDRVIDGASSADGSLYVSLSDDQKIRLWDLGTRQRPTTTTALDGSGPLHGLALAPNGDLAVGTDDGHVIVVGNTGDERWRVDVGSGAVFALTYAADGRMIAGDAEGTLTMWNPDGSMRASEPFPHGQITDVVMSPDGKFIASSSSDGQIAFWDASTLAFVRTIADAGVTVYGVAFTPDGDVLSADLAGRVGFWSSGGGPLREPLQLREDALFAVAVDPTGTRFAVAGGDEAIAVHSLDTGENLSRLTPLAGDAVDVVFLDEDVAVGLSRRGVIGLWVASTGEQLGPLFQTHDRSVASWRLAIDGDRGIWSSSEDGAVNRLDVLDLSIACDLTTDVFDALRQATFLGGEAIRSCTQ